MPCRPDQSSPANCRTNRFLLLAMLPATVAVLGVAVGCSQPARVPAAAGKTAHDHDHDDHDHDDHGDHGDDHGHEHPTTLAGAVDAIHSRLVSLEKAFKDHDHDEADAIVHEIGHLLEDGDELLAKAPEAVAAKARGAWNELGDRLADVDEKLHAAGDDKDAVKAAYEAVRTKIESAVEALREHARSSGK